MTMALRRLVTAMTFSGLAVAVGLSLAWVFVADGPALFEAAAQTIGLVAAFAGIMAERFAAERHRRRLVLVTLTSELSKNRVILDDLLSTMSKAPAARRRVYPRLLVSATDGAITSGAFAHDRELFARLHEWRNDVTDFNRRLDLTEMLTFLQGTPEAIRGFEQALSRDGGRVYRISRLLDDFVGYLDENHHCELPRPAGDDQAPEPRLTPVVALRRPDRHVDLAPPITRTASG